MRDPSFKLVRVRGQLVRVASDATDAEIEAAGVAREARLAASAAFAATLPESFDRADPRPLLLIDVDGVICPFAGTHSDPAAAGLALETLGDARVFVSRAIAGRLQRLALSFQLVWCTAWQVRAAELIAPWHGLPALPVIRFDEPIPSPEHWKWPAIEAFVGSHPCAWIDDELREPDLARARGRASHTFLVRIEPVLGLADEDVDRLEAFARSLS